MHLSCTNRERNFAGSGEHNAHSLSAGAEKDGKEMDPSKTPPRERPVSPPSTYRLPAGSSPGFANEPGFMTEK